MNDRRVYWVLGLFSLMVAAWICVMFTDGDAAADILLRGLAFFVGLVCFAAALTAAKDPA